MSGSTQEVEKWVAFVVGLERGANLALGNSYDRYADTNPTQRDLLDFVRGGILPPASRSLRRIRKTCTGIICGESMVVVSSHPLLSQ